MRNRIFSLTVALLVFLALPLVSAVAGSGTKTYTGYLSDILCVESGFAADGANMTTNPEQHTVQCALMKPCIESGYTLLVKNSSGGYDSYPLDERGNKLALKYLKKTKKVDNIVVSINGPMVNDTIKIESIKDAM